MYPTIHCVASGRVVPNEALKRFVSVLALNVFGKGAVVTCVLMNSGVSPMNKSIFVSLLQRTAGGNARIGKDRDILSKLCYKMLQRASLFFVFCYISLCLANVALYCFFLASAASSCDFSCWFSAVSF